MIDVVQQVNAVERSVGSRRLPAGTGRTVVVRQTYAATGEDLWDACTNAERIPRWFLPVTGDLRLHGHYQLEGNAGGTVEACDPPRSFAATWEAGGDISWIEVRITDNGSEGKQRATLEIEHIFPEDDPKWALFGPGAVGLGWDSIVMGLGLHLSTGVPVDPTEAMSWMMSAEGRQFFELAAQRWQQAHLAAGATESEARSAAERTVAAYTEAPEAAQ